MRHLFNNPYQREGEKNALFYDEISLFVMLSHLVTQSDLILRKKSWERLHKYICQLIPYYGFLVISWTLTFLIL